MVFDGKKQAVKFMVIFKSMSRDIEFPARSVTVISTCISLTLYVDHNFSRAIGTPVQNIGFNMPRHDASARPGMACHPSFVRCTSSTDDSSKLPAESLS